MNDYMICGNEMNKNQKTKSVFNIVFYLFVGTFVVQLVYNQHVLEELSVIQLNDKLL